MDGSVLGDKSSFKMLELTFSSKLDCSISINLQHGLAWDTVDISGLLLLDVSWNYQINYKNGYVGLLFLYLLPLWSPWLIVKM